MIRPAPRPGTFLLTVCLALSAGVVSPERALAQAGPGVGTAADEADVHFQLGNQAYKRRDYRGALSHYFTSHRLAPNRNVLFNIARCYEQLKSFVEAYRYYLAYEAAGPLSDKRQQRLRQAMARVRPNVALLRVATQPAGATIYLNRKDLGAYGTTPAVLAVAPGKVKVLLELEGYRPTERSGVSVQRGKAVNLEARLDRIVGRIELTGGPAGAKVRLELPDGPVTGELPTELVVPPGLHPLSVTLEGHLPYEERIRVEAGQVTERKIQLAPRTGSLLVQSDERDALIRIDGRPAGFTPAVFDKLAVGEHAITVEQVGFRKFTTRVDVRPDKQALLDVELEIAEDVAAASRLTETAREAPASVSLIGRRELDAFGYTDAYDAVQGTRGVFGSDDLTYKSVGLRGFSPFGQYGNRLLVLLDGHTLNDDWIGSSYVGFDLMTDLDPLERIEMIRGPGSALYGTGAFFGVLNLVSPGALAQPVLRAGVGSIAPGVARTHAFAGADLGGGASAWVAGGGLLWQGGDYFSPARLGSAEAPDGVARGVGESLATTGMGKVVWRDLTLQFYYHKREKQIPTASFDTVFGDKRTRSDDDRAFVELRYEPQLTDWFQLLSRLYYDHYEYHGAFSYADDPETGVAREYYLGDWAGAELRGVFRFDFGLRLTVGGSYEMHFANPGRGADRSGDYYHELHPYQAFAGYLVADYAPATWFSLSAGARFDGWLIEDLPADGGGLETKFLESVNPRLGLIFKPTADDTLKLLGGSAFRAPSIYELTYWDGGITQVQSPGLEPELIYTGELEYTRRLPAGFWLTAAAYVNHIRDLIAQVGEGDEFDPLRYVNQDDAVWTIGGELELRKEFRRGWMLGLQYSFQHTRLGDLTGDKLANSPVHVAGGKLIVPLAGKALRLATRAVVEAGRLDRDSERTDPGLIWDVVLSGEIDEFHMRYSAGVRNLLDWRVEHPVGEDVLDTRVRQPGRSLLVDLTFFY